MKHAIGERWSMKVYSDLDLLDPSIVVSHVSPSDMIVSNVQPALGMDELDKKL